MSNRTRTYRARARRSLTAAQRAVLAWIEDAGGAAEVAGQYVTAGEVAQNARLADALFAVIG